VRARVPNRHRNAKQYTEISGTSLDRVQRRAEKREREASEAAVVLTVTFTVPVLAPSRVRDAGEGVQVAFKGAAVHVTCTTVPVKPPPGVSVSV
jgi:hypothetical protein